MTSPCVSVGGTCFGLDEQALYIDYHIISENFSGWSLSDVRGMKHRERKYWIAMIKWKRERNAAEADAAGGMGFASMSGTASSRGAFGRNRKMDVSANFSFDLPGMDKAASQIGAVNSELQKLKKSLQDISSFKFQMQSGIIGMLKGVETQAKSTSQALGGVSGAVGGKGGRRRQSQLRQRRESHTTSGENTHDRHSP